MGQNKGDNAVTASGVNFKQVVNALLDKGFSIEKIDSNYGTVKTEWKEDAKYSFKERYEVRVKDGAAILKGEVRSGDMLWSISNDKAFLFKYSFNQMSDFAKELSASVAYSKQ